MPYFFTFLLLSFKSFHFFNLLYTFCVQCVIIFYIQILEIFSSLGITLFAFFQKKLFGRRIFLHFSTFRD